MNEKVKERYAERAREVWERGKAANCCGSSGCCGSAQAEPNDVFARSHYDVDKTSGLPREAVLASLGCCNPTACDGGLQPWLRTADSCVRSSPASFETYRAHCTPCNSGALPTELAAHEGIQ